MGWSSLILTLEYAKILPQNVPVIGQISKLSCGFAYEPPTPVAWTRWARQILSITYLSPVVESYFGARLNSFTVQWPNRTITRHRLAYNTKEIRFPRNNSTEEDNSGYSDLVDGGKVLTIWPICKDSTHNLVLRNLGLDVFAMVAGSSEPCWILPYCCLLQKIFIAVQASGSGLKNVDPPLHFKTHHDEMFI